MERREFLSRAASVALGAATSSWADRAASAVGRPITLAAVGDCLMTRRFDRENSGLQPLISILRDADVTFGNFEMTLPDPGMYPAATGGCGDLNNSAEGPIPEELRWAGFNLMGLANNHALDYGIDGMFATAKKVGAAGIVTAGTGRNLQEARCPAYYDSRAGRSALIACSSTIRAGSLATEGNGEIPGRPGLNPLRVHTKYQVDASQLAALQKIEQDLFPGKPQGPIEPPGGEGVHFLGNQFVAGGSPNVITTCDSRDLRGILASVRRARRNAALVLVGVHAHEAHGDREIPATFLPEFAHACIDAGAHAFIGHGPHVLRAVEIYKNRPIFYSLGNFIFTAESMPQIPQEIYDTCGISGEDPSDFFDRAMKGFMDEVYWRSVIAQATFIDGELSELKLHPVDLQNGLSRAERGMPVRAEATQSRAVLDQLTKLSNPFGTKIIQQRGVGIVR
jgi:poly-gamma-glutamate capsule biosynthesis protein CapA/YwtB (metallophosphatase superfamily)